MLLRLLLSLSLFVTVAHAQSSAQNGPQLDAKFAAQVQRAQAILEKLDYKSGEVPIIGGKAKLHLGDEFLYLSPEDTRRVIVDVWGNPPSSANTEGMIVPKENGLEGWAAVLQWTGDGYVKDDDFSSINFSEMLTELKKAYKEGSKQRIAQGYSKLELLDWAKQPHYDRSTHKLYYAKSIDGGQGSPELHYDIRVLGRHGHIELSVMSGMERFSEIEKQVPGILRAIDFTEGNRYTDYKNGDKVATYGIAGLIAGGMLAKTGFFKGLLLVLAKGWKLVAVGAVAIGAYIRRMLAARRQNL